MSETSVADDAKVAAEAASEDGGAQAQQDEVERLLAEYRESKSESAATETKQTQEATDLEARLSRLEEENKKLRERDIRKGTEDGLKEAVNAVKDEVGLPARVVRGLLLDDSSKDPRLTKAFLDRHENPEAWAKILKGKAAQWKQEIGSLPDKDLTADREAILASASGANKAPPEPRGPTGAELAAMTPEEREADRLKWLAGGA